MRRKRLRIYLKSAAACLLVFCLYLMGEDKDGKPISLHTSTQPQASFASSKDSTLRAKLKTDYGRLPLSFEVNRGQANKNAKFIARGSGFSVSLTPSAAIFSFHSPESGKKIPEVTNLRSHLVQMELLGASATSRISALDKLPGKSNYFIGSDPQKWRTNIPTYARIRYSNVYPGIDLVYYGNQHQLEYDFVVKPGADPTAIQLAFSGARDVQLASNGDLVAKVEDGEIRQRKPRVYQDLAGGRQEIAGGYTITGEGHVSFEIGRYEAAHPLVIDPVLVYSAVFGGNAVDQTTDIAVDSSGNAFVTGFTASSLFPTFNPFQPTYKGIQDAVVFKINSTGTALVYSTYLGGSSIDQGTGIAVDASGNAYVCGHTVSSDFPTQNALYPTLRGTMDSFVTKLAPSGSTLQYSTYFGGGALDRANSLSVDSAGNAYLTGYTASLDFPTATPFQGTGGTSQGGPVLFRSTDAAVTWTPSSTGIPNASVSAIVINPLNPSILYAGTEEGGVFKSMDGGSTWASANSGITNLQITALVIDPATPSTLYACTYGSGIFKSTNSGGSWGPINNGMGSFVKAAVIDPGNPSTLYAGASTIYKTINGGTSWTVSLSSNLVSALAINPLNPAIVYGGTSYQQVVQTKIFRSTDAGTSWQTVYTGGTSDEVLDLAIDPVNPATIYAGRENTIYKSSDAGNTWSILLPQRANSLAIHPITTSTIYAGNALGVYKSTNGGTSWTTANTGLTNTNVNVLLIQSSNPSILYAGCKEPAPFAGDAFVTKINPLGTALVYSTYLGGSGREDGNGITIDGLGNAYVTGRTNSTDFPTFNAFQNTLSGGTYDVFVTKLSPTGSTALYSTYLGGSDSDEGKAIALDAFGNIHLTGGTYSSNFPIRNAIQEYCSSCGTSQNGFVTKLDPPGSSLVYSTYLLSAPGWDVGVDTAGNAHVSGYIESGTRLPIINPLPPNTGSAFLAKLNPDGSAFFYSTRIGGNYGYEDNVAVALGSAGSAHVTGGYVDDLFVIKVDDPEPVLSLGMTQPNYTNGQIVTATNTRLHNPSASSQPVELKLWLAVPGINPISLMNFGSDGSFVLPAGYDQSLGSLSLFTVTADTPAGSYELSSRMLNATTGSLLSQDLNPFSIGGTAVLNRAKSAAPQPPPRIDITVSVTATEVTATEFRISNPGSDPVAIEFRVWLRLPDLSFISLINLGSDGSFSLSPGFSVDLAPLTLVSISGETPKGTYEISSRVIDPLTGKQLSLDYNEFKIQ